MTGVFYDANNVAVGIAALYLQKWDPANPAALPTDTTPFQAAPGGTAEVDTVTISGSPTGGTFTLTYNGHTTDPIQYNATNAAVQAALRAIPGLSGVTVTGTAGGPYTVTFPAVLGSVTLSATGSFTGGTTPAIAVARTTPGVAGWFSPGGTDQGYSLNPNAQTNDLTMEEQAASVGTTVTSKNYQIVAALAEWTTVNRALYYGGDIGVDADGNTTITMSDEPQIYAGYFEYRDASQLTQRLLVPKGTVVGTDAIAFRRAADKRMLGIQYTSSCNSDEIVETTYDAA
jgi:hypothetical protein